MAAIEVTSPFPFFVDTSGNPLDAGYVFVGSPNTDPVTNPIAVYWDEALTIPASQPIRTSGGYLVRSGTPANVFAGDSYSITVKDQTGRLVYTSPNIVSTQSLAEDLADTSDATKGDALIGVKVSAPGAIATDQHLVNEARPLYAKLDFGAVGDWNGSSGADDTTALQTAIDAAIAQKKPLIIESGNYRITSPLKIFNFTGSTWGFVGCTIKGERQAHGVGAASAFFPKLQGVTIYPTFNNTAAFMVQAARGVRLECLSIYGTNALFELFEGHPENHYKLMTPANMNTNGSRDSRYSPYAGIVIDPFGTSVPADGGYPGMSTYYSASAVGSSDVTLVDVDVRNFIVGLMLSPSGTTYNDDQVVADNCLFGYCKTAIAGGQDQSRGINLHSCQYYYSYTAFDGVSYGAQTWAGPKVFGGIGVALKYIVNCATTRQDVFYASGLYCEALASIGFLASSGSLQSPALFAGCSFAFTDFNGTGPFPDYHLYTSGCPITFTGCQFGTSNQTNQGPVRIQNINAPISFDGVSFTETQLGEIFIAPSTSVDSVEATQVYYNNCSFTEALSRGDGLTSRVSMNYQIYNLSSGYGDRSPCPYGAKITQTQDPTKLLYNGTGWAQRVSLGSISIAINLPSIGRATFTAADADVVRVGDQVYAQLSVSDFEGAAGFTSSPGFICIGSVASVVGTTVTLNGIPQSMVNGSYTAYLCWMPRMHAASTADTNSSTSLTNVSPTNSWKNGQRIKGTGIPSGAYIVSGGGTATLTISKAATATAAGVRIYDADIKVLTGTSL